MKLSMFSVVHERGDAAPLLDDPLIQCQAGQQLVLAYVLRTALMDYFRFPGDKRITVRQWNLVVDRNLDAFKQIIQGKFERDEWEVHNRLGQSYPRVLVTLEDMQRRGEQLTAEVLNLDAGFRSRPVSDRAILDQQRGRAIAPLDLNHLAFEGVERTHLALHKDCPLERPIQRFGSVVAIPVLAGLHHQYARM
jgi:hypothetical protein